MPELPEVEILARQLHKKIAGFTVSDIVTLNEHKGRSRLFGPNKLGHSFARQISEKKISGRKVIAVSRRAKFLRVELEGQVSFWIHLGMSGRLFWSEAAPADDPHVHMMIGFRDLKERLVYRDVRKFGRLCLSNGTPESEPDFLKSFGREPFEMLPDEFVALFKSRSGKIKSLLLNQMLIAGLGNIYADEALFRAGIHPRRRPDRLSGDTLTALYHAIRETLEEAIQGGGSTIRDYQHTNGEIGSFQKFHRIYGREGKSCVRCGTPVRRIVLSGRGTSFCPQCQR